MSKPAQNIDLWKQANSTLENIEEELREARFYDDTESRNKDMRITKERAKELRWLCKVWPGERCKNIKPESEGERKRVKEIWDKNPSGFSSYYSTLCDIEQGRVEG